MIRTRDLRLPERFWQKVREDENGCWRWTGAHTAHGYGHMKVQGRMVTAHRMSYTGLVGPVPEGLVLDHLCRTRDCVNPTHLEPVTRWENVRRGVGWTAQQARKTHCKRGHPFDEGNTYLWNGKRCCRTCRAATDKAARAG